jgi:hypothetical protein
LDVRDRVLAAALAEPLVREAHDITIYELASRLEDDIRSEQPHMQDVVVHTEP